MTQASSAIPLPDKVGSLSSVKCVCDAWVRTGGSHTSRAQPGKGDVVCNVRHSGDLYWRSHCACNFAGGGALSLCDIMCSVVCATQANVATTAALGEVALACPWCLKV